MGVEGLSLLLIIVSGLGFSVQRALGTRSPDLALYTDADVLPLVREEVAAFQKRSAQNAWIRVVRLQDEQAEAIREGKLKGVLISTAPDPANAPLFHSADKDWYWSKTSSVTSLADHVLQFMQGPDGQNLAHKYGISSKT